MEKVQFEKNHVSSDVAQQFQDENLETEDNLCHKKKNILFE